MYLWDFHILGTTTSDHDVKGALYAHIFYPREFRARAFSPLLYMVGLAVLAKNYIPTVLLKIFRILFSLLPATPANNSVAEM